MLKEKLSTLGLDEKATKPQIKSAFRELAIKFHPDKSNGNESKFLEINDAYNFLAKCKDDGSIQTKLSNTDRSSLKNLMKKYGICDWHDEWGSDVGEENE